MANALYPSAKELFLEGSLDWDAHNFKVVAVSSSYTYNSAHDFRDDLTGTIATSANLASKTTTGGVADAADLAPAFTSVSTDIAAIVIYRDVGTAATDPLVCYIDTGTGFPLTNDGGNVNVTWNASGIFAL